MIYVNGEKLEGKEGMSVTDLLDEKGFVIGRIAVECNGEILPKACYDKTVLKDNDKLEVVNFVGGG